MLVVLAGAAVLGYALHRALLAMERKGWIYYRTKGTGSMGASAMFALSEALHPEARSAVVEKEEQDLRGARSAAAGDLDRPVDDGAARESPR